MSLFPPSIPGIFRGIERLATLSRNDAVDSGTGVPPVLFGLHLRVKSAELSLLTNWWVPRQERRQAGRLSH